MMNRIILLRLILTFTLYDLAMAIYWTLKNLKAFSIVGRLQHGMGWLVNVEILFNKLAKLMMCFQKWKKNYANFLKNVL
jgi:hypothetical protein